MPDVRSSDDAAAGRRPKLLDQVRSRIRVRHYSRRTERAYIGWIRRFILFHGRRHPREMGEAEVAAFLSALATARGVAASTQNQALSAIVFLYAEVLGVELDWLSGLVRARQPERLPVVLTREEVGALLGELQGTVGLMAALMYGAGLRLMECAELRVKDIDLAKAEIRVRDGKGRKDRLTVLPARVASRLAVHLERVKALHDRDVAAGGGWVALPDALGRKYPHAGREWGWQWVFPATRTYVDAVSGERRRHHLHNRWSNGRSRMPPGGPACRSRRVVIRCAIMPTTGLCRACARRTLSARGRMTCCLL